ncbi:MAG TPA: metallophosphoesterase, partial [Candidatus Sulfotelmatobacter sp.]|nr:metallophosphoesterase [Candidatus Sulfotelmatobacter sp.]
MGIRLKLGILVAALGVLLTAGGTAHASDVVASWIQLAPGSTAKFPTTANFGDAPLSMTPTILARAIVSDYPDNGCPSVTLNHDRVIAMTRRFDGATLTDVPGTAGATNGKTGYPQYFINASATAGQTLPGVNGGAVATTSWTECEAVIPSSPRVATIDGVDLKLPVSHPHRILVMADTGCRMNGARTAGGANQQDCQDPRSFPLQMLAGLEVSMKPDLIVQVGDWFYRDTNCLTSGTETYTGCNTTTSTGYETWGDTFDSWNADLFYPAKSLLAAAPWVMVRGNHESCGRGARGWYALLDPHPYDINKVECAKTAAYPAPGGTADAPTPTYNPDFEPTYIVPVNNVNYLVHDSSFANDSAVDTNMAKNYEIDMTNVLAAVGPKSINIYATHKPTFGLGVTTDANNNLISIVGKNPVTDDYGDYTEQAAYYSGGSYGGSAFLKGVPANIALFLSGHIHQLQYVNFANPAVYAPALIVGTGGDLLDADIPSFYSTQETLTPAGLTDIPKFVQDATNSGKSVNYKVYQYNGATTLAPVAR